MRRLHVLFLGPGFIVGFLSFYGSVRGFTVADQDLQQTFHQASFVLLLMPARSLNLGCASQSTANSPLADVTPLKRTYI